MVGSLVSGSNSATSVVVVGNGDNNGSNGAVAKVDDTSVRVALRIRPPLPRELINNCQTCITVTPGLPQVWMGQKSAFTYDYVFDQNIDQETVFGQVRCLIEGCLEGFNATILAYGQTGSGKTYTMGTGFDIENIDAGNSQSQGIVPRAVHYLFQCIEVSKNVPDSAIKPTFKISIQFIELYNEEIIDLVDGQQSNKIKRSHGGGPPHSANQVKIHEDSSGGIYLVGVGTQTVHSAEETLKCLRLGALGRTTASTNMNDQSSRSHAIFTIHIEQTRMIADDDSGSGGPPDFETLTAKFHFVDLAGSERLKRTGAVGDRQKEGISINCGLLALGNVISALGDKSKKALHVPYRDSKLTRLLQDSLGGNSRTIMIACVSPCDVDFLETLNTLKYANRARNIKNKVTINQDKSSRLIADLKDRIKELEDELLEYKQGKRTIDPVTGEEIESDTYQETKLLQSELNILKSRNESLQSTVDTLTAKNTQLLADRTLESLNGTASPELTDLVQNYTKEIEQLSTKLIESEHENDALKRKLETAKMNGLMNSSFSPRSAVAGIGSRPLTAVHNTSGGEGHGADILEAAKRELESQKDALKRLKRSNDKPIKIEPKEKLSSQSSDEEEEENDENEEDSSSDEAIEGNDDENYSQLVSLSGDITTKEKLIEQLESTQRRIFVMAQNYEEKLSCLAKKITATEEERDKVMKSNHPAPKLNQIKIDYEKKLGEMQNELKKWQQANRSHQKLIRDHNEKCRNLEQLKTDLEKMKQTKVKLMNQIKTDAKKFNNLQTARAKEIAQLKKEQRKKDNMIRQLTSDKQQKEGILKRKHEEINYLKNKMRAPVTRPNTKKFSPLKAKQNWTVLQSKLMKSLQENQKLESYESEMMKVIEERKQLNVEMEEYRMALRTVASTDEKNKIIDQMDTVSKSLEYVESRITELQGEMLCYSTNDNDEDIGLDGLVQQLNKEECSYIMTKMYEYCRENIGSSKQHEKRVELLEKENQKIIADLDIVRELYRHLYTECNNNRDEFLPPDSLADFGRSHHASQMSRSESKVMESSTSQSYNQPVDQKARKARRLTATPDQLLGTSVTSQIKHTFLAPTLPVPLVQRPSSSTSANHEFVDPNEITFIRRRVESRAKAKAERENSTNGTKPGDNPIVFPPGVRMERRNTYTIDEDHSHPFFPKVESCPPANGNDGELDETFIIAPKSRATDEDMDIPDTSFLDPPSPPTNDSPYPSPLPIRKSTLHSAATITNNVFQRLTSQTATDGSITSKGKIVPLRSRTGILYNTHIAEGHSKSVLSICATENRLYSGGIDTTVKIWDLNLRKELQTLVGSPGNIAAIRCSSNENLIFAASSYCVKIWDRRADNRCIKTLTSAGTVQDDAPYRPMTSLTQVPITAIPTSEQQIQALAVTSHNLFTSYGDRVRAWDLRKYKAFGLLAGKHQSNIMCLEATQPNDYETTLVTGSKDHRIKVYKLGSNATMPHTPARLTLEPPHYDGIQALLLSSDGTLFSGSRDTGIKKWNLSRTDGNCMVQAMNNAHSNWVTGLAFAPTTDKYMLSVSRDGYMKLWSVEGQCYEVDKFEVNKGKSVECIATNSTYIFTGSSDGFIGFWKFRIDDLLGNFATPPRTRRADVDDPNYEDDEC